MMMRPSSSVIASALRQASVAAFITFILGAAIAGVLLEEAPEKPLGYTLIQRWQWVLGAAAVVFIGKLLWVFTEPHRKATLQCCSSFCPKLSCHSSYLKPLALIMLLAFAILIPFLGDRTWTNWGTLVLLSLILAWGLNIVVGYAGLLDLGYVAFFAIGAYAVALVGWHFQLGFWVAVPLAMLAAMLAGVLIGFPILRLRGDYLAIVTLAFAEIVQMVLVNAQTVTGGPNGVSDFARPTLFGLHFNRSGEDSFHQFFGLNYSSEHRLIFIYLLALIAAGLVAAFSYRIRTLPLGRAWEAMREDEIACRALGINLPKVKLSAYVFGAMIAGLAGALFAAKEGFVSPTSFRFLETAKILAIVVLGGMGSMLGILIAGIFLVLLPEVSREFAEYRMLFFGLAMVLIMIWKPGGLIATRQPTVRLPESKSGNKPA